MPAGLDVLPVTTSSVAARAAYEAAAVALAAGRAEARAHAERAVQEDANLALAWIVLSILDRQTGRMTDAGDKIRRARSCVELSPREGGTIRFFEQFGRDNRAAEAMGVEHLRAHPRDHLVVMYMHFLYNLSIVDRARRKRHADLFRSLATRWPADDWFLMAELAFVESEAAEHDRALELARQANEARPDAGIVAHGFADALLETGRADEGGSWLRVWLDDWGEGANQACHLTWHEALFALAAGDEAAVAVRLDEILNYAGHSISALSDGASLLWRLHLDGRSPGSLPWQALAQLSSPPGFAFSNLHRGFVLAGLDDIEALRDYAASLAEPAKQACLAIADFAAGEPATAADRLLDLQSELVAIGGSRAQLEVLDDTLIAALARSGRASDARRRLSTRLSRRSSVRDQRWLRALTSS